MAARRALLPAVVTAVALVLVPASADAYVYWANGGCCLSTPSIGTIGRANNDGTGVNENFIKPPGNSTNLQGLSVGSNDIFWVDAEFGTVGHANIDGSSPNNSFIIDHRTTAGVASDSTFVFWSNYNYQTIYRANVDGSSPSAFLASVGPVTGMTDVAGTLYWVNSPKGTINDSPTATPSPSTLLTVPAPFGGSPPSVEYVAVGGGYVYWTDSANNTIGRASLANPAGTANDAFITDASGPEGVAVDSSHIYWSNSGENGTTANNNTIGRANLDGTGVNQRFITGASVPFGLAVDSLGVHTADPTSTSVSCSPASVVAPNSTTCTATVTDTGSSPSTPTGSVSFTNTGSGSVSDSGSCTLSGSGASASCSVTYTPGSTPATPVRSDTITATYGGDTSHTASSGSTQVSVISLPASKDQCKNGGWQVYGVFKNQGDCVSYVATDGKNPLNGL